MSNFQTTDASLNALPGLGDTGAPKLTSTTLPGIVPIPSVSAMEGDNTFLSFKGGLTGIPPSLGYPGYLYPNDSDGMEPGVLFRNMDPEDTAQPWVFPLKIMALSDNYQSKYDDGDFLFLYNPFMDVNQGAYVAYAIHNLNYGLEICHRRRLERNEELVRDISADMSEHGKRRTRKELYDNWPGTVKEFMKMFVPKGVVVSSLDKKNVRKRTLGIAEGGLVRRFPHIFVDERGRFPGVGDTVGLLVKPYHNDARGLIDLDGKATGSPTPGPFLQVKGYWEYDGRNPIHCTSSFKPSQGDVDFVDKITINQTIYEEDNDGMINFNKQIGESKLTVDLYQQGYYIRLGRIVRKSKDPSPSDIEAALRSKNGWVTLQKYSEVEIELEVNPCNTLV